MVFFSLIRTFAAMFEELKEKYRQFREWQQRPYQVKPLSDDAHVCPTCGTQFEGNYCPRCGQSSKIGRYSFKNAFLLFLDVWGLGNRGMFRTIRDLILRPGYMIRDYLQGMQMAYFPPFKLFFLLIAVSLLVETGLNIRGTDRIDEYMAVFDEMAKNNEAIAEQDAKTAQQHVNAEEQARAAKAGEVRKDLNDKLVDNSKALTIWINKHITIVTFVLLLLFSGPLYLFFRHCPNIPDMRFSEFFVSVIYFTNMTSIFSIIFAFFGGNILYESFFPVLAIIPLKQLSGYSYWRTIWKTILALLLFFIPIYLLIFLYGFHFAMAIN